MTPRRSARDLPEVVTRTRNPVRRAFHLLASGLAWLLFAWFWFTVFARPLDRRAVPTFLLLLAVLLGIVAANALWVGFNRGIYRRRGRRSRVREVVFAGTTDRLGRSLEGADWERLRGEAWIRIDLDARRRVKRYTGVSLADRGSDPQAGD